MIIQMWIGLSGEFIYLLYSYTFGLYFVSLSALTRELNLLIQCETYGGINHVYIYLQLHIWLIFRFVDRVDEACIKITEILIYTAEI